MHLLQSFLQCCPRWDLLRSLLPRLSVHKRHQQQQLSCALWLLRGGSTVLPWRGAGAMRDTAPKGGERGGKRKPASTEATAAPGASLRAVNPHVKPPLPCSSAALLESIARGGSGDVQEVAALCPQSQNEGAWSRVLGMTGLIPGAPGWASHAACGSRAWPLPWT